jgi:hypothetical protein
VSNDLEPRPGDAHDGGPGAGPGDRTGFLGEEPAAKGALKDAGVDPAPRSNAKRSGKIGDSSDAAPETTDDAGADSIPQTTTTDSAAVATAGPSEPETADSGAPEASGTPDAGAAPEGGSGSTEEGDSEEGTAESSAARATADETATEQDTARAATTDTSAQATGTGGEGSTADGTPDGTAGDGSAGGPVDDVAVGDAVAETDPAGAPAVADSDGPTVDQADQEPESKIGGTESADAPEESSQPAASPADALGAPTGTHDAGSTAADEAPATDGDTGNAASAEAEAEAEAEGDDQRSGEQATGDAAPADPPPADPVPTDPAPDGPAAAKPTEDTETYAATPDTADPVPHGGGEAGETGLVPPEAGATEGVDMLGKSPVEDDEPVVSEAGAGSTDSTEITAGEPTVAVPDDPDLVGAGQSATESGAAPALRLDAAEGLDDPNPPAADQTGARDRPSPLDQSPPVADPLAAADQRIANDPPVASGPAVAADQPAAHDRSVMFDQTTSLERSRTGPALGIPPVERKPAVPPPTWQTEETAAELDLSYRRIFELLVERAGIAPEEYALGSTLDETFCLVECDGGFDVFYSERGTRRDLRRFADERAAYYYLFGQLAASAVRAGRLTARPAHESAQERLD